MRKGIAETRVFVDEEHDLRLECERRKRGWALTYAGEDHYFLSEARARRMVEFCDEVRRELAAESGEK